MNEVSDRPFHILIVDDEEPVRRYVDRILTTGGYQTTVAVDCADAIAAGSLDRFDLLLTDVMMPEMSGAELAAVLRRIVPELNVLYLTGYADRLFREKANLGPREAFLEKPCNATALRQAVSLAITGSTMKPIKTTAAEA
jgi:two-component system cell cycle sensor histidine kinase/response regulator CckA